MNVHQIQMHYMCYPMVPKTVLRLDAQIMFICNSFSLQANSLITFITSCQTVIMTIKQDRWTPVQKVYNVFDILEEDSLTMQIAAKWLHFNTEFSNLGIRSDSCFLYTFEGFTPMPMQWRTVK